MATSMERRQTAAGPHAAFGCGTVFELTPAGDHWAESVLYSFSGPDGNTPESPVTLDASPGNIFGTTFNGGLNDCVLHGPCGVVYELQRTESGWIETVLHEFNGQDGYQPVGGIVMDKSGNLYGTTPWGGSSHLDPFEPAGTVYELSPTESGWLFQVLYRFPAGLGQSFAGLTLDGRGNLYGTTTVGGIYGAGSVFELQRPTETGDPWMFANIFSFDGPNGSYPVSGVVFDKAGNLYGAGGGGGTGQNCDGPCGIVYELIPSDGGWTETVLYNFQGDTDGAYANSTPVLDPWGNLYGTTAYGGDPNCVPFPEYSGCGIVYRIKRSSPE
ncbi:MAG: choice-of-anchor tandem repeat GloVer-containing protein [Candidatus Sulfotelmatobacter sp.]